MRQAMGVACLARMEVSQFGCDRLAEADATGFFKERNAGSVARWLVMDPTGQCALAELPGMPDCSLWFRSSEPRSVLAVGPAECVR